ncbi:hypothetical protein CYY_008203 [Polysphondylium violaceum]|uniref:Uncharacterized protein n=1 Tax=Polysphondylium violaceum TaxID=133409 RepID=A0A8J4PNM3_9MYCE|nr:hypothetical protein CYY_008203 [Polysphondylium violaceum]
MNKNLYTLVFNNIYISNKIFNTVHQLQLYNNSLKYNDIVYVDWMIENNHIGLIKDKLKRNIQLHVELEYLFTTVANKSTDIFIGLFKANKYRHLKYIQQVGLQELITNLDNVDVAKYLFEQSFIKELKILNFHQLYCIDTQVLQYLVESGYCKPTFESLLLSTSKGINMYYNPTKLETTRNKIEIILNFIQTIPLSNDHSTTIINSLLKNPPPLVFDSIKKLLDQRVVRPIAIKEIKKKETEYYDYNSITPILPDEIQSIKDSLPNTKLDLLFIQKLYADMELLDWYSCIGKSQQEFINLWNRLESKIRVADSTIYYNAATDIDPTMTDRDLAYIKNVKTIHQLIFYIISNVETKDPLKLVQFLIEKGMNNFMYIAGQIKEKICHEILKNQTIDQKDCETIYRLAKHDSQFTYDVLSSCCKNGHLENFNYFFKRFKNRNIDFIVHLLENTVLFKNLQLYHKLEEMGHYFSDYPKECRNHFDAQSFGKTMLSNIDRIIGNVKKEEEKRDLCCTLFANSIGRNDFISFKYIIENHFQWISRDFNNIIEKKYMFNNLAFIGYLSNYESTLFNVETKIMFFSNLFNLAITKQYLPLAEYLIQNNCIKDITTQHRKSLEHPSFMDLCNIINK